MRGDIAILLRGNPPMPSVRAKKRFVTVLTIAVVVLAAGLYAVAQQPYQLAPLDEAKRDRSVAAGGGTYHVLPATLQTNIKKIVPKAFATNFHLPGAQFPTVGQLGPEFPQGFVRYYYLDWDKR